MDIFKKNCIMKKRNLRTNTHSVVGIVATILFIGLIITFIGVIKIAYVPKWLEQKEAQHMNDVENQFTQLKSTLDLASLLNGNIAISNYITLGSEELPIYNNGRTYDTLEISSDDFRINFSNSTDSFSFSMSDIVFSSKNSYFINQIFCLEAGALILSQPPDSILLGQPLISITNFTNVSFSLLNISGLKGKAFVSGYGTYVLSNEFIGRETHTMFNVTDINITSSYPEAWADFFNSSSFVYSGLTYSISQSDDSVHVKYSEPVGNFDLDVLNVRSQIVIWRA